MSQTKKRQRQQQKLRQQRGRGESSRNLPIIVGMREPGGHISMGQHCLLHERG
jgi:hypothetical protein